MMGGIGSGKKPKLYDPTTVELVRSLYGNGRTQTEIAAELGLTQRVVWSLMRRHGLPARIAAKRDQRGAKNTRWKGDSATYQALHLRVYSERGRPTKCAKCGTDDPARRFHWANLTGNYADVNDYASMCVPCHKRYDLDRGSEIAK